MSKFVQIFIILIVTACANMSRQDRLDHLRTLQDKAPEKMAAPKGELSNEMTKWWSKYKSAQSLRENEPDKSCEIFYQLSQEEDFKLKKLAFLRALEVCPANYSPLAEQEVSFETYRDSFLKKTALDALILWNEKKENELELMDLYLERSKHQTLQSEKLESMDQALKLAEKFQLKDKIRSFQERLEGIAPRRKPKPQWEDLYEVAQDYRRARMFAEAVDTYQRYMRHKKAGPDEGYLALKGLRELRRLTRNDDLELYMKSTKNLAKFTERIFLRQPSAKWSQRHHAMGVQWARTLWTYGRRAEAEEVLKKLARQLKGNHSLAQIYWLRSRIDLEKNDLKSSLNWLARARKEKIDDSSLLEDVLWDIAWGHRKLQNYDESLKAFEELEAVTSSEGLKFKSMFWRAKTLRTHGKEDLAHEIFETLILEDVLGYYGLLAYHELDRSIPSIPSDGNALEDSPEELEWLLAVQERELALAFVQDLWDQRTKAQTLSKKENLRLLQLFARAGEFLSLFRHFSSLPADSQKELISENYTLLFPQIFRDEIQDASQRFSVPEALIYSIIRQESAFNPQARSWADAFGLMQLLPSVGEAMAETHNIAFSDFEDLYSPEKNILLGSAFLRKLMSSHHDQFVIVVASYNASEKAIYNWIKTRYQGEPLEFIEEIPYRETQGYVKLVLRNFVFYQRILSTSPEIPFPSETFLGLGEIKASLSQNETGL